MPKRPGSARRRHPDQLLGLAKLSALSSEPFAKPANEGRTGKMCIEENWSSMSQLGQKRRWQWFTLAKKNFRQSLWTSFAKSLSCMLASHDHLSRQYRRLGIGDGTANSAWQKTRTACHNPARCFYRGILIVCSDWRRDLFLPGLRCAIGPSIIRNLWHRHSLWLHIYWNCFADSAACSGKDASMNRDRDALREE